MLVDEGQHGHHQLETVQQDGIPGFAGVSVAALGLFGCSGSEEDLEVGEEKRGPDTKQIEDVGHVLFLYKHRMSEQLLPRTEDVGVEDANGLRTQGEEDVGQCGHRAHDPDPADQNVGSFDSAEAGVPERQTDGDVTLHRHNGQVQRSV